MEELARYQALPVDQLRDKVMDELVRQYSLERVDLEDFERRTELVARAQTRGELLVQVADLPPLPAEGAPRPPAPAAGGFREAARGPRAISPSGWSVDPEGGKPSGFDIAIFGGSDYKGPWRAPRQLTSLCVFGGSKVDLRKAIVPADGVTITCACIFGGVDIIVPSDMRVAVHGIGIFGGFDHPHNEPDDPGAPTINIDGIALFGGVSVKVRD